MKYFLLLLALSLTACDRLYERERQARIRFIAPCERFCRSHDGLFGVPMVPKTIMDSQFECVCNDGTTVPHP